MQSSVLVVGPGLFLQGHRCFLHLSGRHNHLEAYILVLVPCATLH